MFSEAERLIAADSTRQMVEEQLCVPDSGIDTFWLHSDLESELGYEFWIEAIRKVTSISGSVGILQDETGGRYQPDCLIFLFAPDIEAVDAANHMNDISWKFLEFDRIVVFSELTTPNGHFEIDLLTGEFKPFDTPIEQ